MGPVSVSQVLGSVWPGALRGAHGDTGLSVGARVCVHWPRVSPGGSQALSTASQPGAPRKLPRAQGTTLLTRSPVPPARPGTESQAWKTGSEQGWAGSPHPPQQAPRAGRGSRPQHSPGPTPSLSAHVSVCMRSRAGASADRLGSGLRAPAVPQAPDCGQPSPQPCPQKRGTRGAWPTLASSGRNACSRHECLR